MPGKKVPSKKVMLVKAPAPPKSRRAPTKKIEKRVSSDSEEEASLVSDGNPPSSPSPTDQTPREEEVRDVQGAERSKQKKPTEEDRVKKRRNLGTIMSEEDEAKIAEWLRENPCIYQKTLKSFKDAGHKSLLWQEKAKELGVESGALLKTWYDSIRTRVGKLHKEPSGSAAKDRSDRDKFIWANFGFLADHITKMKGRTAFTVSI